MKKIWKRVRGVLGLGEGRAHQQGFVERVGPQEVSGWVIWSGDEPPAIQLVCGVTRFSVDTVWHERQDVAAEFPQAPLRSGFFFPLPAEARSILAHKAANAKKLRVLADGMPVKIAGAHVFNVPLLQASGNPDAREDARRVSLFTGERITLDGRAISVGLATGSSLRLVVTVTGNPLPALAVELVCQGHQLRPAHTVELSGERQELIFEVPGYWWSLASAARGIPVQVLIGEQQLPAAPVVLSLMWGRECLQRLARRGAGDTHDQLLALEHAHFLQALAPLDTVVATWLQSIATDFRLGDFLTPASAGNAEPQPDVGRQQLIDALREVNRQMPAWRGREQELVRSVASTLPTERQRESLRETLLPWFCREGRLGDARAMFSPAHVKRLSRATSAWQASLVMPFLVADDEMEKAIAALRALPGLHGWIVTECLAEASRHVLAARNTPAETEKFGAALLALMEKWSADYWSRKEDIELIACCVTWLEASPRFSARFRNDLYLSALRIYGLSPAFWSRLLPLLDADDAMHARLAAAGARFQRLALAVRGLSRRQPVTPALSEDLAFFRRAGCRDAARFIRELGAADVVCRADGHSVQDTGSLLLDEILSLGESEIVRVAAWPAEQSLLRATEVAALPARVLDLQRNVPRSTYAALQRSLALRLRSLASASTADTRKFLADVEILCSEASSYLSVDILAAGWCVAAGAEAADLLAAVLVRHLDEIMTAAGADLPAQPLLAAMARLDREPRLSYFPGLEAAVRRMKAWLGEKIISAASVDRNALAGAASTHIESDVLVVVYSCRKYLDSRIAVIRDSWLKDLKARGIPYVIVVGDGDNTVDGDVLQLAVPDRYEDLPAKTLAIARWALANTTCEFLLKIDDDCLLNVAAFFDDLVYRQFHYYGRVLRRDKGGTDRRWHQQRSQGEHARHTLDKSPEPSVYADGGGGYSLSRLAMTKMLSAAQSSAGVRLISASFMEDKVVGDLLAMAGIAGRSDEYHTLVRRKYGAEAEPVNVFENTFFPSPGYPAKLAHLDSPKDMPLAWQRLREPALWPKKLWPSHVLPSLDYGKSNQLELLTPLAKLRALGEEELLVVSAMRNEKLMLPNFLRHYRGMGVRAFIVIDNLSDDGTREMLLAEPDVVVYSSDSEYRHSMFGVAWQQTILATHCLNKWALVADADELLVCPGGMDLPSWTAKLSAAGCDAGRIMMVDMYPAGDLAAADIERMNPFDAAPLFDAEAVVGWRLGSGAYNNAGSYVSGLRHRLIPAVEPNAFTAQKYSLVRYAPWMRFCGGLHNVANARVAEDTAWFAHFKYHAGFKARVDQEVVRQQHFGLAQEYRRYQSLLADGGGFDVPGISMKYSSPADFMRIIVAADAHRP